MTQFDTPAAKSNGCRPQDFHWMYCHLNSQLFQVIDTMWPQGDCAIYISLSQDVTDEILDQVVVGTGWHLTRRERDKVAFEPRFTREKLFQPGSCLFHATTSSRRQSIQEKGLVPYGGGNTDLNRSYPDRVYYAIDILGAFSFIDHQCGAGKLVLSEPFPWKIEDVDLYRVCVPAGFRFYSDPFYEGRGVWCEDPMPADRLQPVENWSALRAEIERLAKEG